MVKKRHGREHVELEAGLVIGQVSPVLTESWKLLYPERRYIALSRSGDAVDSGLQAQIRSRPP